MSITVSIDQEPSQPGTAPNVDMGIYIQSRDLAQPGWQLLAFVPSGVQPLSPLNTPQLGRVTPLATGGDAVYIDPGPSPKGAYGTFLAWNNLTSGPMQVSDANLVATFPEILVENETSATSPNSFTPPNPTVTLSRELQPGGSDYAYLGGLPPDHESLYTWSWNPVSATGPGSASIPQMTIEAQSAIADEKSHSAEFQSGILFGVAAAALIAGLQEFMNANRRRKIAKHKEVLHGD